MVLTLKGFLMELLLHNLRCCRRCCCWRGRPAKAFSTYEHHNFTTPATSSYFKTEQERFHICSTVLTFSILIFLKFALGLCWCWLAIALDQTIGDQHTRGRIYLWLGLFQRQRMRGGQQCCFTMVLSESNFEFFCFGLFVSEIRFGLSTTHLHSSS